ncbi:MAG: O-antigen ligase family protein [Candidatus Levyibacteriota bacterium]
MKLLNYCNKVIEYSFYSLLFLVPLVFSGDTSELFELNKMWLTFGITIIVGLAWGTKMILQKRITIQRTPLDIALLLFLLSQIISSIFTLDAHISWWGYYSRFNGGLLSTLYYVLLYYAFASNLSLKALGEKIKFSLPIYFTGLGILAVAFLIILGIGGQDAFSAQIRPAIMALGMVGALIFFIWSFQGSILEKVLFITLNAGLLTALWGFPAHFGFDPTCQLFQGKFDVSCWTEAFQPKDRTFSTLGQPAWLAAYMAMLTPIAMAYALRYAQKRFLKLFVIFSLLTIFFYISLLFSNTRAAFYGFWIADLLFWGVIFTKNYFPRQLLFRGFALFTVVFFICNFLFNTPIGQLNKFTLSQLTNHKIATLPETISGSSAAAPNVTDSGDIRLLVWQGALKIWENNPLFGTGVETYAFDYYKYKSPAHNLTSEWDYLYNKAHNEYLNYLATTGIFGLGTYLAFLGIFLFGVARWLWFGKTASPDHQAAKQSSPPHFDTLVITGLVTGWISILITNFFGFSVVIMNIYLFLIPLFVFAIAGILKEDHIFTFPQDDTATEKHSLAPSNPYQWTGIIILIILAGWMEIGLIIFRQADIAYALGNNLDKIGNYGQATPSLLQASQAIPDEPVYKDELSVNLAAISAALYAQKDTTDAAKTANTAIAMSNEVVTNHPNNVVYWKNRVRLFYTLSTADTANQGADMEQAVKAIDTAKQLAPTDAKVAYNQAVLYGQIGQAQQSVTMLENTIKLKPDYVDAYVTLGVFYHQLAVDKNSNVVKPDYQKKAISTYEYILKNLAPNDKAVKKSLEQWRSEQGIK